MALVKSPPKLLHSNAERRHACLVPGASGKASQLFPFSVAGHGCVLHCLDCVEGCSFYLHPFYLRFLIIKDFMKCFFCTCWDNHVLFTTQLVNVVYHIYSSACFKPSLHIRDESHFVQVNDLSVVLLDSVT